MTTSTRAAGSAENRSAHLGLMTETHPSPEPETQPSFGDLTRVVKQQPVYGLHLPYHAAAPSPLVPNLTGEVFVSMDYLEKYAAEQEWVDSGAAVYETDPVMRSAMVTSGLAAPAWGGPEWTHLHRTAKFVEVWNALFADLSGYGRLTRPNAADEASR